MHLFLGNLPTSVSELDIYNLLSKYGIVMKIKILRNIRGKSLCEALVNIKAALDTHYMIDKLQNANFKQQYLIVYDVDDQQQD